MLTFSQYVEAMNIKGYQLSATTDNYKDLIPALDMMQEDGPIKRGDLQSYCANISEIYHQFLRKIQRAADVAENSNIDNWMKQNPNSTPRDYRDEYHDLETKAFREAEHFAQSLLGSWHHLTYDIISNPQKGERRPRSESGLINLMARQAKNECLKTLTGINRIVKDTNFEKVTKFMKPYTDFINLTINIADLLSKAEIEN